MGKPRKGRLTPVERTVHSTTGKLFSRRYWISGDKIKPKKQRTYQTSTPETTRVKVSDFLRTLYKLADRKIPDEYVHQLAGIMTQKIVPGLKGVFFDNLDDDKGRYIPEEHVIELDNSIKPALKTTLLLAVQEHTGFQLIDKVRGDFKSENSVLVRDFIADIGVVLHEAIHALAGNKDATRSFEEGTTELLTVLFSKQLLEYLTQNKLNLSDFISEKIGPDGFVLGMALSHQYAPFMFRIVSFLKYIGLSPEEAVESLIDFKLRNKETVTNEQFSFVGFMKYLKQKFPGNAKLKSVSSEDIETIIKQRRELLGEQMLDTSPSYERNRGVGYIPDKGKVIRNPLIMLTQFLDSTIHKDSLSTRVSLILEKAKKDTKSAIKEFLTYLQDISPKELEFWIDSEFLEYFSGDKFDSSLSYFRKMVQYSQKKYSSFKDFLNFVKWRKNEK